MDACDKLVCNFFVQKLGMDISSAFAFVENGFTCLEEVAYVPFDELTATAGMSESSLHVWRQRACKVLARSALDSEDDGDNDLTETIAPRPPPGSGGSGAVAEVDEGNPEK